MGIQIIKDLASLVRPNRGNILDSREDRETSLFQLIDKGVSTKEYLVDHFFQDGKYSIRNYNRLQRSLRDRLVNTLFTYEPKKRNYRDIYFSTAKQAIASELLWAKGKSSSAALLAKEALEKAIQYHFTNTAFTLSRLLADHYAGLSPNAKMFRRYQSLFEGLRYKLRWEKLAEEYYYNLAFRLRSSKAITPSLIEEMNSYLEELDSVENISWEFIHHRTAIHLIGCNMRNDGQGIITISEKVIDFYRSLDFELPNRPYRSLSLNLIPAYFQTGSYQKVNDAIQQVKSLLPATGYNWIAIHQYEAISGFHMDDLEKSQAAIKEIKRSKLAKGVQEEIRIYETYLAFLSGQPIRMNTFLNDTPRYYADKKGMNINRLILQVLILLSKNNRAKIIDRAEALEKYAYRYLKHDETTRRSQIFMRLLFLTVRHSFDWPTIQKQTAKTYAELLATPRHLSTIDIEVVPYEVLWGKVGEIISL